MNKIGIIGAMKEEVDIVKEYMEIDGVVNLANLEFTKGSIYGKNVVLVECGIGKVNAAMCAQILISEFKVDALINTGVAGALNENLDVLDIVVSEDALYHDFDVTGFGYPIGQIPRMETSIFKADQRLIDAAMESANDVLKENKIMKGRIVTGDIFVENKELKDKLVDTFGGYCTEMEGASIAHVATLNEIPFVIIRSMSDKADGSADITYDEFMVVAAKHSRDILLNMLRNI